jgi:hypothetical protein
MTEPRPDPDESSGVPLCVESCPHYRGGYEPWCVLGSPTDPVTLCHPRIRDLVALSRRRCDGCHHWSGLDDGQGACDGFGDRHSTYADECCSRWRARP